MALQHLQGRERCVADDGGIAAAAAGGAQACTQADAPAAKTVSPLKLVVRWLDSLEAQVDFGLAAMVGGVGEVGPEVLRAGEVPAGGADNGVHAALRHLGDGFAAKGEGFF